MPRLFLPGGYPNQPQGVVPQLKPEFAGARLVYLPSFSLLHEATRQITVQTGTPTLGHIRNSLTAHLTDTELWILGTQGLDFTSGMTVLAVGSYFTVVGTEIHNLLNRETASGAGGFELDLYNQFAPTKNSICSSYNKPGVGDTNWDSAWINGTKDLGNGNGAGSVRYVTAINTRYAVAVTTKTGPAASVTTDINIGRVAGYSSSVEVELLVIWPRSFDEQKMWRISADPNYIWQAPRRKLFVDAGGGDVTAALTGVSGVSAVGTVAPSTSKGLTGNTGTGAAGTVGAQSSGALTGVQATGSAGTVAPSTAKALTGVAGTGAAGTLGAQFGNSITGNAATGAAGSVTPVRAGAITGVSATSAPGTVSPSTATALTGNAATGAVGSLSAASNKALTGTAATGAAGTVAPSVTVALTGVAATGAVGSVSAGADVTQALTGVSGTGAAGTVSPSVTVALAGVTGTGAVGSVTAGQLLTGVEATGSVGTVAPSASKALTGVAATGALGSVGPNVTVALSGVQANGAVGTISFVAEDITIALTGVEATGAVGVLAVAGEFSSVAAAVWSYVLSNGKTAGQNVVEIRSMLDLLAPGFWNLAIEGTYTAADLLRVIAAVQAGKSTITALGGGAATVEFRAVDDSVTRVTATMDGSERTEVTLNVVD